MDGVGAAAVASKKVLNGIFAAARAAHKSKTIRTIEKILQFDVIGR